MDLTARPFEEYVGSRDLAQWRSRPGRWLARRVTALSTVTASTVVLVVTALIGGGVAVLLAAVFAEIYEMVTDGGGVAGLDQPLLTWIVEHRTSAADAVVTVFTTSGGPVWMPVVTTAVTLLLAWRLRTWAPVLLMVIAVAGSVAMTVAGKVAVGRHRPPLAEAVPPYESSASFPSGHSLNSMVIAGVVVYFLLTHVAGLLARALIVLVGTVYAVAMGLSRVYLGHHWLSDVLGAWALGLCWVGLLVTAHRLALTHRRYRDQVLAAAREAELRTGGRSEADAPAAEPGNRAGLG